MNEEDRRQHSRRIEDLDNKYNTLFHAFEIIKTEHTAIKNLIQSNTVVTQAGNKIIENKLENMERTLSVELKRAEVKAFAQDAQIEELKELANKVKGSLATFNWIGLIGIVMASLAFVKVMFFGKP